MTKNVEIGIDAKLHTGSVRTEAKQLEKTLQGASKVKIDPVSPQAVKKLDALFQAYLKLDREMARRLKITGQSGMEPEQINWDPVYQNSKFRKAKLQHLQTFLQNGGADFTPPQSGGGGGGGDGGAGFGKAVGGVAVGAAQAGLRSTGSVGGVAADAIGAGMASGFGAGMMGFLGGIAALGASKLGGASVENIDQAAENNIAYDRLKRTLGDVQVSFEGLKTAVKSTGDGLRITYEESERLFSTFAKVGNVKGSEYGTLPGEVSLGVGFARGFGLDNDQGVGALGLLRGMGATRDTQDSRRMAILIGETIAKSDAFAKASEVLDAVVSFTAVQTRQNLAAANTEGYAGMFSAMAGSGIPGLDPSNVAGILARVNGTLAAGGGRGEASQFFTSRLGAARGMDVFDTQLWREGGAFSTADSTFGGDGAVARYYKSRGLKAPTGSETLLEANLAQLRKDYSDPKMLLNATANQMTGGNMSVAASLLDITPNEMGELKRVLGGQFQSSGMSGLANAAKAMNGTDADRQYLAASLRNRSDLSQGDRDTLDRVMSGGSQQEQKEVLAKLSAQYEQERTMGTDIRDSRAALDNIKTNLADKVVPYLLDAKKALIYMAGDKGQKTPSQVMEDIAKSESRDRMSQLKSGHDGRIGALQAEKEANKNKMQGLNTLMASGMISKEEYAKQWGALSKRNSEIDQQIDAENTSYGSAVENESNRLSGNVAAIRAGAGAGSSGGSRGGGRSSNPAGASQAMQFFMSKGLSREQAAGLAANLEKESSYNAGALGDGGQAYGIAQWHPDRQQAIAKHFGKTVQDMSYQEQLEAVWWEMTEGPEKAAGDRLRGAKSAREAGGIVSRYYERPGKTEEIRAQEAAERGSMADRIYNTPLPTAGGSGSGAGGAGHGRGSAISFQPLTVTVTHRDESGREVQPPQEMQTRVGPANANTYQ